MVSTVHADTSCFTGSIQSCNSCEPVNVRVDTAHDVVLARPDRDWLVDRVNAHILLRQLLHKGKLLLDNFLPQMSQVQMQVAPVGTVEGPALLNLSHFSP